MPRALLPMLVVLLLPVPPASAAEPPPSTCGPPRVTQVVEPRAVGVDGPVGVRLRAPGAERVEVDWGDGARTSAPAVDGWATPTHRYAVPGPRRISAVAIGGCGSRDLRGGPATLDLLVRGPCADRRGADLAAGDCDALRGRLALAAGRALADGRWRNPPCNDTVLIRVIEPGRRPVARAASCRPIPPTPAAANVLTVRPGAALTLRLGLPADAVSVRIGASGPVRAARRADATGRLWRVRAPRRARGVQPVMVALGRGPGLTDEFVAGLRLRRGAGR